MALPLRAQPPLRTDRKHIAHDQHPDHQHRIDRRATRVRVVTRKLSVHPIEIESVVNLAYQVIGWHHLVELKRIKELTLSAFPPTHHRSLPRFVAPIRRNHGSTIVSTRVLQPNHGDSGRDADIEFRPALTATSNLPVWP